MGPYPTLRLLVDRTLHFSLPPFSRDLLHGLAGTVASCDEVVPLSRLLFASRRFNAVHNFSHEHESLRAENRIPGASRRYALKLLA